MRQLRRARDSVDSLRLQLFRRGKLVPAASIGAPTRRSDAAGGKQQAAVGPEASGTRSSAMNAQSRPTTPQLHDSSLGTGGKPAQAASSGNRVVDGAAVGKDEAAESDEMAAKGKSLRESVRSTESELSGAPVGPQEAAESGLAADKGAGSEGPLTVRPTAPQPHASPTVTQQAAEAIEGSENTILRTEVYEHHSLIEHQIAGDAKGAAARSEVTGTRDTAASSLVLATSTTEKDQGPHSDEKDRGPRADEKDRSPRAQERASGSPQRPAQLAPMGMPGHAQVRAESRLAAPNPGERNCCCQERCTAAPFWRAQPHISLMPTACLLQHGPYSPLFPVTWHRRVVADFAT